MKIFISHSSLDKVVLDKFVDAVLRLSCGYKLGDIVYTSRQSTGVDGGNSIPEFIKGNMLAADVVLLMISDNYKKSEVCLNEMGAAWVLSKNMIQVLLPNTSFDKLGWLTSMDKALKMDVEEDLDKLFAQLKTPDSDISDWGVQRKSFLDYCKKLPSAEKAETVTVPSMGAGSSPSLEAVAVVDKPKLPQLKAECLTVFDTKFYLRAVREGMYQYQINLRMHAHSPVTIREVRLANNQGIVGYWGDEKKFIKLNAYIPYEYIDINQVRNDVFPTAVDLVSQREGKDLLDMKIPQDGQLSMTLIGCIESVRMPDGWEDLPKDGWRLEVDYNINERATAPLTIIRANGSISAHDL